LLRDCVKRFWRAGSGVFVSLAALNAIDAPEYGVSGGGDFYENGGAGFYKESSAVKYEPPATPEELALEEAEEAEELARYEAAMDRYARDNAAARAQLAEDAASSVE
jgi:hypothetical protein